MHVLLIDDDPKVAAMVDRFLRRNGVKADIAPSGADGLKAAAGTPYDAILLDIRMPDLDGFETLERLRDSGNQTPVLFLTGSDSTQNLVRALDEGGDDFIEKPFQPQELLARLRAVVRRARGPRETVVDRTIRFHALEIDTVQHRATWQSRPVELTRTELRLLHALVLGRGDVVSRDELWQAGWGAVPAESETLGVHVSNLRKRLADVGASGLIATVRGKGYRLDP